MHGLIHAGQCPALQQFDKHLQDLVSELIEEAEFKGKQVFNASIRCSFAVYRSCSIPKILDIITPLVPTV